MDNILPENEYTEVEGRAYLNPQVALDESNTFIDNLRATQGRQNQEIITDTQMLGTDVPSNIGGLTGANSYFTSRYQTPQTNANVANLRATAQAAALNQVLANEQEMWKKRYQDAYRAYQQRSWNKTNQLSGIGGGNSNLDIDTNENSGASTDISQYTGGEYESGKLYPSEGSDYVSDYKDASGQWWQVSNPDFVDVATGPSNELYQGNWTNEKVITKNGRTYMYLDNIPNKDPAWYRVTPSAEPGTYSPYAGS